MACINWQVACLGLVDVQESMLARRGRVEVHLLVRPAGLKQLVGAWASRRGASSTTLGRARRADDQKISATVAVWISAPSASGELCRHLVSLKLGSLFYLKHERLECARGPWDGRKGPR